MAIAVSAVPPPIESRPGDIHIYMYIVYGISVRLYDKLLPREIVPVQSDCHIVKQRADYLERRFGSRKPLYIKQPIAAMTYHAPSCLWSSSCP